MVTDSDLDALSLGSEREVIGAMADYANSSGGALRSATNTFSALPFEHIGQASTLSSDEREKLIAQINVADKANDALIPSTSEALRGFMAATANTKGDFYSSMRTSFEKSGKETLMVYARLVDARKTLLKDMIAWLSFFQRPKLKFEVREGKTLFGNQQDIDSFKMLQDKMLADVKPSTDAYEAAQKLSAQGRQKVEDIKKL